MGGMDYTIPYTTRLAMPDAMTLRLDFTGHDRILGASWGTQLCLCGLHEVGAERRVLPNPPVTQDMCVISRCCMEAEPWSAPQLQPCLCRY